MKHHLPLVFQIASLLTVAGVAGTSCGFDDLAGRDSGEGSFVFLQLFQYPSGELELMYFRSGKYPVRDVAISWEDETKQSASHPTTPEASYELGTQTTTMFRLGDVGLAVTESVGRPLATIPVPTNATTQDFVARIADLHGARQQHFSLRPSGETMGDRVHAARSPTLHDSVSLHSARLSGTTSQRVARPERILSGH